MRYLLLLLPSLLLFSCYTSQFTVEIPPRASVEVDYPDFDLYEAKVKNKSSQELEVKVLNKDEDQFIRGFGLESRSDAKVIVEKFGKLYLRNNSDEDVKVKVRVDQEPAIRFNEELMGDQDVNISFTLENTTAETISLVIPDAMNPNLSPNSTSRVDLKVGQEIYFQHDGEKYLLFKVDESIRSGAIVDVAKLIKDRKDALGLD